MNDCGTMCRGCNRSSNGEEYCARCEDAIAAKERADDERGFALPVRAVTEDKPTLYFLSRVMDANDNLVCDILLYRNQQHREVAELISDAINTRYADEQDGA